ncbi:hypothetical protein GIB67_040433 [Kingdonia uniflora]|uniref:60S ribosomal protein L34 n=1 Tax=Kingdonia uniflora TaxID=39325 RepID=A0A7J7KXU0_9MAGN|nr:hypothetical protein GIB67_040433 [Kingdonia uniflora]
MGREASVLVVYWSVMFSINVVHLPITEQEDSKWSKCPIIGKRIQQIPHLRPAEYKRSRLSGNRRTVNHAYGGVLVEGPKIVKKVLKIQKTKERA